MCPKYCVSILYYYIYYDKYYYLKCIGDNYFCDSFENLFYKNSLGIWFTRRLGSWFLFDKNVYFHNDESGYYRGNSREIIQTDGNHSHHYRYEQQKTKTTTPFSNFLQTPGRRQHTQGSSNISFSNNLNNRSLKNYLIHNYNKN